eukprot:gnl/TRDRNA2_/TRDRNA2_43537_c0_seq1.p1 gnl/TRDRNA2_/TRDRNA2_43537_c0~~gnl/TRDRNA2_/TRDRNA2_43537_c0_seq1.p1  ORF type:complete len:637 (-),score=144.65 gnl/TRDRNA2_/TRDRNA2_43537_c0_seq1:87-1997(-)
MALFDSEALQNELRQFAVETLRADLLEFADRVCNQVKLDVRHELQALLSLGQRIEHGPHEVPDLGNNDGGDNMPSSRPGSAASTGSRCQRSSLATLGPTLLRASVPSEPEAQMAGKPVIPPLPLDRQSAGPSPAWDEEKPKIGHAKPKGKAALAIQNNRDIAADWSEPIEHFALVSKWQQANPKVLKKSPRTDFRESVQRKSQHVMHWTTKLLKLPSEDVMNMIMVSAIVVNAVVIGLQTEWMCKNLSLKIPTAYVVLEILFCVIFTCELIYKIKKLGMYFFTSEQDVKWNIFEVLLVICQWFDVIGMFVTIDNFESKSEATNKAGVGNYSFMRLLRIVRLLRVLRMVRLLRFVQELNTIVSSILASMRSLCWTILLLVLLIYIVGILFAQIVFDHIVQQPNQDVSQLIYWWGTLGRTLLSLYEVILGGADWDELVFPLIQHISPVVGIIFCLYIAFTMLAMMNVITGIFVESALENAQNEKDAEFQNTAGLLFDRSDENHNDHVSWEEFVKTMDDPDFQVYLEKLNIDSRDAKLLFHLLDSDASGEIEMRELLVGMVRLRAGAKFMDVMKLIGLCEGQNKKMFKWVKTIADSLGRIEAKFEDTSSRHITASLATAASALEEAARGGQQPPQETSG